MLDHVGFAVSDSEVSKRFYEAALAPLGLSLIMTVPAEKNGSGGTAYGFGTQGDPFFWVGDNERVGRAPTSPSAPIRAIRSTRFTRRRWRPADGTTGRRGRVRNMERTTMRPSSSTRTD